MEGVRDRYVEIATGTVANRGRCIHLSELGKEIAFCQTTKQELYRSHFFFDGTLLDHLRAYKTVRGFLGKPIIDQITLDVDKGSGSDEYVHTRAKALYYRLHDELEIDDINIRPYYSGSGFHFVVPNLWNFESAEEVKETFAEHFPELDTIYDKTRLIRVPNTINYKTQRYKIPLETRELLTCTIAEIIEASLQPRNGFRFPEFEPNNLLEKYKRKPQTILSSQSPMVDDGFTPIVTCMQKLYSSEPKKGMRHISMLRMISAYKRAGIPRAGIEAMMRDWSRGQMEVGEIRKIVGDVFSKNYSYSCNDEIMRQHCDSRCMFYKNKSYNNATPESSSAMEEKLRMFAAEGTKNVILNLKEALHLQEDFNIFRKEFVVIIGDTKLGKSALAQNLCVDAPFRKFLYMNFEVGETLMYRRLMQMAHRMSKQQVIDHYTQQEPKSLAAATDHIQMVSNKGVTLHAFEQLVSLSNFDAIIVDTLECFSVPGMELTPKTELIAHEMKRMADKYNLAIIAIHHVSKHGVQNVDGSKKRLTTHAGKGSGAVEQQADKIIAFEGDSVKPLRRITSLGARDEAPFECWMNFDAGNTFRFYPVRKESSLTSSEPSATKTAEASPSSMSYHSSS